MYIAGEQQPEGVADEDIHRERPANGCPWP